MKGKLIFQLGMNEYICKCCYERLSVFLCICVIHFGICVSLCVCLQYIVTMTHVFRLIFVILHVGCVCNLAKIAKNEDILVKMQLNYY